jgi:hypothetical protein
MILPQTDHTMITIAAASLLLPKRKMPSLPATTPRSPLDAVEVARWGYKLHRRTTPIISAVGRAQKARATSATKARSGMLGLLSPTPTLADAPRYSLTVIASMDFRFCLRCARVGCLPPRKTMCR